MKCRSRRVPTTACTAHWEWTQELLALFKGWTLYRMEGIGMGVKREEVTIKLSTSNHGICWAFFMLRFFLGGLSLLLKVMVDYFLISF
jgi:hypothetical protein